jgi:GNAT superfamily N-acetyltransferase
MVAVTRTYLEMTDPARHRRTEAPTDSELRIWRLAPVNPALFRELYRRVGEPYHWHDRSAWTDDEIAQRFSEPGVSLWMLSEGDTPAGYYELEQHEDGAVEIAYFGLLPGHTGRGLGKVMLSDAVDRAWATGTSRVWLHTCTLDSPAALPNYERRGFEIFRTECYEADLA